MNMSGPLAQGALAAAKAEVSKQMPNGISEQAEAVIEWAVGAALRYLAASVLAGTTTKPAEADPKPARVNEPPQAVTDLGGDPLAIAKAKGFSGDMCKDCGSMDMVRTGTCSTCTSCGSTSGGCS